MTKKEHLGKAFFQVLNSYKKDHKTCKKYLQKAGFTISWLAKMTPKPNSVRNSKDKRASNHNLIANFNTKNETNSVNEQAKSQRFSQERNLNSKMLAFLGEIQNKASDSETDTNLEYKVNILSNNGQRKETENLKVVKIPDSDSDNSSTHSMNFDQMPKPKGSLFELSYAQIVQNLLKHKEIMKKLDSEKNLSSVDDDRSQSQKTLTVENNVQINSHGSPIITEPNIREKSKFNTKNNNGLLALLSGTKKEEEKQKEPENSIGNKIGNIFKNFSRKKSETVKLLDDSLDSPADIKIKKKPIPKSRNISKTPLPKS